MYRQGMMARGDYYQGDGLFSFIGKALKTVAPILPLGIGTAASAIGGVLGGSSSTAQKARTPPLVMQSPIGGSLPPSPNFYGIQAGGVKVGVQTNTQRSASAQLVGAGGKKRRRMNVTNPRALRRAIRRARGFEKMARKVLGFTSPRKPKGRVYFRNKRRAS